MRQKFISFDFSHCGMFASETIRQKFFVFSSSKSCVRIKTPRMELRVLKLIRIKEFGLISEDKNFSICSLVIQKFLEDSCLIITLILCNGTIISAKNHSAYVYAKFCNKCIIILLYIFHQHTVFCNR